MQNNDDVVKAMLQDKGWLHVIRITLANLPAGCINPSKEQITEAMQKAIAKEQSMYEQLLGNREKFNEFAALVAPLFWDAVHA